MQILKSYTFFEENIKGSRFLSEIFPCKNQNDAKLLIKSQKEKYADASHVVHAFIIGTNAEIMGMSDDGEPSGTAGRPILDVLKGRNCTNLILTVTRWFGGTLLGTGGLVKAYGDGAKCVLNKASELLFFEEYVEKSNFSFKTDYSFYKSIKMILSRFSIFELNEEFGTDICITGKIKLCEKKQFCERIFDLTKGKVFVE